MINLLLLLILNFGIACGLRTQKDVLIMRNYECDIDRHGTISIQIGDKNLICNLHITYPGGWNHLSSDYQDINKSKWTIEVHQKNQYNYIITAVGEYYKLIRTVQLRKDKITIIDKIENTQNVPLGCIIENQLKPSTEPLTLRLAGHEIDSARVLLSCAENPTVFYGFDDCGIGVVVEDDIYRLQLQLIYDEETVSLYTNQFGLAPKKSYIIKWSIYLITKNNYFDFVNILRDAWKIMASIDGPFTFMSAVTIKNMTNNHLKSTLLNSDNKIVALHPWVNYYSSINGLDKEEYIIVMKEAIKRIRTLNPETKILGMIHPAVFPHHKKSMFYQDSRIITKNNDHYYSVRYSKLFLKERFDDGWRIYYYYPMIGNSYLQKLKEDIDLCIDHIGTDGVYFDEFSFAFTHKPCRYSYDRWDGHTVEIDTIDFTIKRKLADLGFLTIAARQELIDYVFEKGGFFMANTAPATSSMQHMPIARFVETSNPADYCTNCPRAHLTSPIGLGYPLYKLSPNDRNLKFIMRDVYAKLEQGLLYYYYGKLEVSQNIVNNFYPITPLHIYPGIIIGKNKIITSKSGKYTWHDNYICLIFKTDKKGSVVTTKSINTYSEDGIYVEINLSDQDIAVIEKLALYVEVRRIPTVLCIDEYTKNRLSLSVSKGELSKITVQENIFNNKNIDKYTLLIESNSVTKEKVCLPINNEITIDHILKANDKLTIIGQ